MVADPEFLGNLGYIKSRPTPENPDAWRDPSVEIRRPTPKRDEPFFDAGRLLTPEQMLARAVGAGNVQQTFQDRKFYYDSLVEYSPRTPDAYLATQFGAGAVGSFQQMLEDLSTGRAVITSDGRYHNAPDLLSPGERAKAEAVGDMPDADTPEAALNRIVTKEWARINGISVDQPSSMDENLGASVLADKYPQVLSAALALGLDRKEISDVNRVMQVKDVAEAAFTRWDGSDQGALAARQMIAALPTDDDRILAAAFLEDIWEKAQQSAQQAADQGENIFSQAGRLFWNVALGPIFNLLLLGNEASVQYATSRLNAAIDAGQKTASGDVSGGFGEMALATALPASVFFTGQYSGADKGTIDPTEEAALREEYGDFAVDVIKDLYVGFATGDDDLLESTFAKYENNPEAWALIQQGMANNAIGDGTPIADLWTRMGYADRGNFGNALVRGLNIDPTSGWATGVRDISNVTAMIVLDPTLMGGRISSALRAAKYGFYLMGGSVKVEKAFSKSGVRNWYDWFGSELRELKRLDDAGDAIEYGRRYTTLVSQAKKFANDETIRLFLKHEVFDAESAKAFYMSMDAVERIRLGKPATIKVPYRGRAKGRKGKKEMVNPAAADDPLRWETRPTATAQDALNAARSQLEAQSAKRAANILVPHQTAATTAFRRTMRYVRGSADITRYLATSTPVLDDVLGPDWVTLTAAQRSERLAATLADDAKVDRLAREISDWAFSASDDAPQRTVAGVLLDRAVKNKSLRDKLGLDRSGWARKGVLRGDRLSNFLARRADRFAKLWSRMPDTRGGINTFDARDSQKVYQMLRLAGVNRPMASMFRAEWAKMSQAQRELAWAGLVRTYGRAAGLDRIIVDPLTGVTKFDELLDTTVSGTRVSERYAADSIEGYGRIIRQSNEEAEATLAELRDGMPEWVALTEARANVDSLKVQLKAAENAEEKAAISSQLQEARTVLKEASAVWKETRKTLPSMSSLAKLSRDRRLSEAKMTNAGEREVNGSVRQGAVWLSQTSDNLAMPNFGALDEYAARRSFFNAFLLNNKVGQTATDLWTFGTLLGPRYQLRNGLEDMVMYGITGGKFGAYSEGKRMSTVINSATARYDRSVVEANSDLKTALKNLKDAERRVTDVREIERLQGLANLAQKRLDALVAQGSRPQKLGIFNTARMKLSAMAGMGAREGSFRAKFAAGIFMPMTTAAERFAAAQAGREGIVALQKKALARQRLLLVRDPEARGIALRLKRGADIEDLSPRQQQILRDMDDFLESEHGIGYEQLAMETARHIADGTMPSLDDMAPLIKIDGKWYRRTQIGNSQYVSERVIGQVTPKQAEGMSYVLGAIVSDGPRGQSILYRLQAYWNAANRAGTPNYARMRQLEDEVLSYVKNHEMWHVYRERFRLLTAESEREFIERGFRVATDAFTTPDGQFNAKMLTRMWDNNRKIYRVLDDDGAPIISAEDFLDGTFKPGYHVAVLKNESMFVPADMNGLNRWMDRGWSAMGRSLARMTREPIFKANYLDAREAFRPLERVYAQQFGEAAAKRWATNAAAERAYSLTMAYTDNPAVRSILAYRVRNVARFYRAVEDFGRRMWRMGRNDPMGFWRAGLLWNATIDTGFVYTDEYGEEYFVYPMARPAMELVNRLFNIFPGGDMGIAFGGKINWLSPSADPDQWMPALASPAATTFYRPFLRWFPSYVGSIFGDTWEMQAKEWGDVVDRATFGTIGADKRLDGPLEGYVGEMVASIPQALPPIVNKLFLGALPAALGWDTPGSFAYKAATRSAMILEANGQGISMEDAKDPKKLEEYTRRLEQTALAVSFGMAVFGLFLPAQPQIVDDTMTKLGRDLETTGMRPAFLKLLSAESARTDKEFDWIDLVSRWTADNPGQGIFTLSTSEAAEFGYLEPLEGNADFAKRHYTLMQDHPIGVSIFGPNDGRSTLVAARTLRMFDVRVPKPTEKYAYELASQDMYIQYLLAKRSLEEQVAAATDDDDRRRRQQAMEMTLRQMRGDAENAGLETRLYDDARKQPEYWEDRVEEIRLVASQIGDDGNGLGPDALRVYEEYSFVLNEVKRLEQNEAQIPDYSDRRTAIKQTWESILTDELAARPGDEQWERILQIMTSAISQGWELPGR